MRFMLRCIRFALVVGIFDAFWWVVVLRCDEFHRRLDYSYGYGKSARVWRSHVNGLMARRDRAHRLEEIWSRI